MFLFPYLMQWRGLAAAELAASAASAIGLVATVCLLPETKGKSLEELSGETTVGDAQRRAA